MRTCVGCRGKAAKSDLLRVVEVGGVLVPDLRGRLLGRGASVHPARRCLDLAERRRAFSRALRVPGPLDDSRVRAYVGGLAEQRSTEQHSTPRDSTESAFRTVPESRSRPR